MRHTLLTVALVACGDYRRGVEPDASSAADVARGDASSAVDVPLRDATLGRFDCVTFCEPTRSRCGAPAHSACVTQCVMRTASVPGACRMEAEALFDCTRTATVRCMTGVDIPFLGCDAPLNALTRCAGM